MRRLVVFGLRGVVFTNPPDQPAGGMFPPVRDPQFPSCAGMRSLVRRALHDPDTYVHFVSSVALTWKASVVQSLVAEFQADSAFHEWYVHMRESRISVSCSRQVKANALSKVVCVDKPDEVFIYDSEDAMLSVYHAVLDAYEINNAHFNLVRLADDDLEALAGVKKIVEIPAQYSMNGDSIAVVRYDGMEVDRVELVHTEPEPRGWCMNLWPKGHPVFVYDPIEAFWPRKVWE